MYYINTLLAKTVIQIQRSEKLIEQSTVDQTQFRKLIIFALFKLNWLQYKTEVKRNQYCRRLNKTTALGLTMKNHTQHLNLQYDTTGESLTWTRKLSIQLYLAHVARIRN